MLNACTFGMVGVDFGVTLDFCWLAGGHFGCWLRWWFWWLVVVGNWLWLMAVCTLAVGVVVDLCVCDFGVLADVFGCWWHGVW